MHPRTYTIDSVSKSQDLASTILSASTPPQISAACASIDSFLHSTTPDQSRHFFSLAFPTLICKLYGFDDSSSSFSSSSSSSSSPPITATPGGGGWIDIITHSNDTGLAARVFSLLSPDSVLFESISAVDRQSLVKYVFPMERLPEWARLMLSSGKDCDLLNSLTSIFRGKIKGDRITKMPMCYQVQLNVFEYFMFWFAYYPICKGSSENNACNPSAIKRRRKFKLENWAHSIPGFSHSRHGNEQKLECNLYLSLLYAYLRKFVPVCDLNSHQPLRSSLLHYEYGNDGSVMSRAEFLVDALVQYWLVDNDFSPLPVNVCKSVGLSFVPLRSVLGETPPTPNLGEVVKLLVNYLNLSAVAVKDGFDDPVESPRWSQVTASPFNVKPRQLVGSWNSWIQRPLYRFILRSFLFCPVGTSVKNASQVFSVWTSYLEPWKVGVEDFPQLDKIGNVSGKDVQKEDVKHTDCGYSSLWQGYVLSNYLYYTSLVMHFIGFAHKFLHTDPEVVVQMVLKVIKIFTSSKELTCLVKNMDTVFHSQQVGSGKLKLNSLHRYVPLICQQLEDWEDGLSESDADGSFLHENWNKDLKLFSDGEDGGQQLLQLLILRAEAEFQSYSGDNLARNLQCVDSLKAEVSCLFGGHTVKPIAFSPEIRQYEQTRDEIFRPRRIGSKACADIKYKGDWMKRPVSDDEVAWLAKLLVWLSSWLNEILGLNQAGSTTEGPKYVEVSDNTGDVCGPAETLKTVLYAVGSWFLMLGATVVRFMRLHGLRVNLRIFASKRIVMVLLAYTLFSILRKAFSLFVECTYD